ncbi:MAG: hypothetical protein ABIV21_09670 [Pyrinomonadaceae bacterium]
MPATKVLRVRSLLSALLGSALWLGFYGCAPSSSQGDASASDEPLEITEDIINERINDARLWEVPEESGSGQPISWNFIRSEPKEITVVDKQVNGDRATIVLDIKTTSSPRSREQRYLAGQIRTVWELKSGMVLRQWEIVETENISMKYKNLPKSSPDNSNR